ncbi:hypothetical protein FKW77_001363 [Venturia effusa]|uniref:Ecp2 effector protein domain-containing protein n=1 Tax=Venturia effusa TaxID=50376 RepID=A0A517LQL7_9PEZI|nr:hypothetical protein FKW77_001363 [Venturia effusa]
MMVHSAVLGFTLLSLVAQIKGASSKNDISTNFTFSRWIDSVISNPDGDVLTPDEALAAWNNTQTTTTSHGRLEKRYGCNTIPGTEAPISDAVWCINNLASRGSQKCTAAAVVHFCTHGRARIMGVAGGIGSTTSSCNNIARAAGTVMDHCTRADNTVQGYEYALGNINMAVWIKRP